MPGTYVHYRGGIVASLAGTNAIHQEGELLCATTCLMILTETNTELPLAPSGA